MHAPSPQAKVPDPAHHEALVSLTALLFIEEHRLLPEDKLADAKKSLQALFLRATGEETLLRKLIDVLRATQSVQRSFAKVRQTLDGIRAGSAAVENKIAALRTLLEAEQANAEEYADFVGPFLSFSQVLSDRIGAFARAIEVYLHAKEEEARLTGIYHIACAARDRLRQRFTGGLGAQTRGEVEARIKSEVVSSFDYSEAESNRHQARRESRARETDAQTQLADIKIMCQMAMNPSMRDRDERSVRAAATYDDVFALLSQALRRHPGLLRLKDPVIELLKMYQRAAGMFALDYQSLSRSLSTMVDNAEDYFESKDEDLDLRAKRERLRRIEGLIPFLERMAQAFAEVELGAFSKFSRRMSELVSESKAPWQHIGEELLRAKIQAEAELSTRL